MPFPPTIHFMEPLLIKPHHRSSSTHFMNSFLAKLRFRRPSNSASFKGVRAPSLDLEGTQKLTCRPSCSTSGLKDRVEVKVSRAQLREDWLTSLSCPLLGKDKQLSEDLTQCTVGQEWVLGVDPDLSGALALLKSDDSGYYAEVFDTPHLKVLVGKRIRRRLDVKSTVQLLQSLNVPAGTTAYVEQSMPCPNDGKQGWWCGGFGYGLWIGILVASGFSVVPVPSMQWKKGFELSGGQSNKDESRELASVMFPTLSTLFKRKKDHGRAEALLIAAYGRRIRLK